MKSFNDLIDVIAKLRAPDGCPWDREQTHDSILQYLFEETNEVADTIIRKDYNHLKEELGDILLHVVMHSEIAKENGNFNIDEVVNDITEKMIRRHPHVFGDEKADGSDEVIELWEDIKAKEKKEKFDYLLDKVPNNFTPHLRAFKLQKAAAKVGFDWDNYEDIINKVEEELQEVKEAIKTNNNKEIEHEIGDLLFSIVNLSRFLKVDSELALFKCNQRFYNRFNFVEKKVKESGKDFKKHTLEELDNYWNQAKKNGY